VSPQELREEVERIRVMNRLYTLPPVTTLLAALDEAAAELLLLRGRLGRMMDRPQTDRARLETYVDVAEQLGLKEQADKLRDALQKLTAAAPADPSGG